MRKLLLGVSAIGVVALLTMTTLAQQPDDKGARPGGPPAQQRGDDPPPPPPPPPGLPPPPPLPGHGGDRDGLPPFRGHDEGAGGPREGGFGKFIPPHVRPRLDLTADQEKQIADLEKEVRDRLRKILTKDQLRLLQTPPGPARNDRGRPPGPDGFGRPRPPGAPEPPEPPRPPRRTDGD
jgi:hypothetical protein